ncbi:DUF3991 and TOPRIM domain-containing protein [Komagataeibacter europaeus]|uniref:DUF3991 and TOPRIM domain-containing protein n=1 Tax=Komagataeibacter europaeus TaxID=33995 RepID=UPI000369522E|nr:DUF3991 and TOPRIM domain-containing protein [Komagataeibacter europaeus]GBQ47330.1 hypothetical protein AA18890_2754 [Komagataeibacter europaeus LMG 18890]
MSDQEITYLRDNVDCRTLLERDGFTLYPGESSNHVWKYVRKSGADGHQIIIVNNHGRGWFAPLENQVKGDVFGLVQYLYRGENFGRARVRLRKLAGIAPALPAAVRPSAPAQNGLNLVDRWKSRQMPDPQSAAWRYLTKERRLPVATVRRAVDAAVLAEGPYGTMWAAHCDVERTMTGWEMRGPNMKSAFCKGGEKALFRFAWADSGYTRLAITEAAIDSMSLATLEGKRSDTLYVSTGGGMGPLTARVICQLGETLRDVVAATDANAAGDRYAAMIGDMLNVPVRRLRPLRHADWNDQLKSR